MAEDLVDQIVTSTNQVLDQLPGWLVGNSRTALADLQRTITETIGQIRAWLSNAGDPVALELAAREWTGQVSDPLGQFVLPLGTAERPELSSAWTGNAAEAYLAVLPAQGTAVQTVQATAGEVQQMLIEFANAVRAFWAAIDVAVTAAIAGLAAAIGAAVTGPTGLGPAAFGFAAAGAFSTSVGATIAAFQGFTATATVTGNAILTRIDDNTGYGEGAWPRSTTDDFADGSVSDGDETDWQVK